MFKKILIANRGEIACRIIRTARRLSIGTVAVYSEADAGAPHVRLADEAVCIGPPPPNESYLAAGKVLKAAADTGAEAIHPGYGFLSENASFAAQTLDAGLVFVGPSPSTITAMGSKREAKFAMIEAGVPTVPGYHGEDQAPATLMDKAAEIGFPVMIKASAGGGGKGMRIVTAPQGFEEALLGARRESMSAFGDDAVLLEKYLERPRHIEFQIFGDQHGNLVHLNERECSIQRRYQKIIEEAPSPFLDTALRQEMGQVALTAARAVGYINAGTVEFIVSADRHYYFMEMNTRLQVEHPVTEMITGLDLVEWQLRVAAGEPLPLAQEAIQQRGHAIEARVYAEDPNREFVPSTGQVRLFSHPATGEHVRVDSGVGDGQQVTIHYDPMLAKLTVWDQSREAAVTRLKDTLSQTALFGPMTNLPLLRSIVADDAFAASQIDTGYIDAHLESLLAAGEDIPEAAILAAACRTMLDREITAGFAGGGPYSPWGISDGWQANGQTSNRLAIVSPAGAKYELVLAGGRGSYRYRLGEHESRVSVYERARGELVVRYDGETTTAGVLRSGADMLISLTEGSYLLRQQNPYAREAHRSDEETHPGSPLPGRIVSVQVSEGDHVQIGQALLIVEGMKMEYTLQARTSGLVEAIHYQQGEMVEAEVPLVDIRPDDD